MVWTKIDIEPRFYEIDSYNIVNNMYYLSWCEQGRFEIARRAGLLNHDINDENVQFVVVESHIHYEQSVSFTDKIVLENALIPTSTSLLVFKHVFKTKNTHKRVAYGETKTVCVKQGKLMIKLPEWMEHKLGQFISEFQKGVE